MKKATRQQTKNHNTQLVLKTIYEQKTTTRAEIARHTRLTRPTVSSIVADLMEDNLVKETGLGPSAGGKRPTLLEISRDTHRLLCLDLSSKSFHGVLVDLCGTITDRIHLPAHNQKGEAALQVVYDLIDELSAASPAPLLGIGIGTPGHIDPQRGIIYRAVNLNWAELPIRQLLQERYHKPVYIANDSHMAGLAEYMFGQSRPSNNLIVIKVGQGIGAGIVLNGKLFYGDGFGAGEIGHVVVAPQGDACRCGNAGCLETVVSTRAILKKAQMLAQTHPTSLLASTPDRNWETIVQAVRGNDDQACQLVAEVGTYLGVTIAHLIASFNIHHIVISGRVVQLGASLLQAIRHTTSRYALPTMVTQTDISFSTLGADIVMLGSSAMILKHELGIV